MREIQTTVEQGVAREDHLVVTVLHEPADAILRVAWRVQALDGDAAQREALAVLRRCSDVLAVSSAKDLQVRHTQRAALLRLLAGRTVVLESGNQGTHDLLVAPRVVPVAGLD